MRTLLIYLAKTGAAQTNNIYVQLIACNITIYNIIIIILIIHDLSFYQTRNFQLLNFR